MVPRPLQCYNCLRYGHSRKFCRQRGPRCAECGGAHATEHHANLLAQLEITNRGRPETEKISPPQTQCLHCVEGRWMDTSHRANDRNCPVYKREQELQEEAYMRCCSRQEALKRRGHLRKGVSFGEVVREEALHQQRAEKTNKSLQDHKEMINDFRQMIRQMNPPRHTVKEPPSTPESMETDRASSSRATKKPADDTPKDAPVGKQKKR